MKQSTLVNLNSLENCIQMNTKRTVRIAIVIANYSWKVDHNCNWDQKKVIDWETRLIPRDIKETIQSLKNPNHINKISYMLPQIWLSNLW